MRKALIILSLLLTFASYAKDYEKYCSLNKPSRTFGGVISSLSGFNLLARNVAENVIAKAIKKETGAKFSVKINNFYANNMLSGEFKSIKATSKKYDYDGIHLSNINVQTICSHNYINYEKEMLYFRENMVIKFDAELTPTDLEKTLQESKIDSRIISILNKISNYGSILSLIGKLKPIGIPVQIDANNKGKIYIDNIETIENNIRLIGYLVINKNK